MPTHWAKSYIYRHEARSQKCETAFRDGHALPAECTESDVPDICEDDADWAACPHFRWVRGDSHCDRDDAKQYCQVTCHDKLPCTRKLPAPPPSPPPPVETCVAVDTDKFCKKRFAKVQQGILSEEQFCYACLEEEQANKHFKGGRGYPAKFRKRCKDNLEGTGRKSCCEEVCNRTTTTTTWPSVNGCPVCKCSHGSGLQEWRFKSIWKPHIGTNGCSADCGAKCPNQGCCCIEGVGSCPRVHRR